MGNGEKGEEGERRERRGAHLRLSSRVLRVLSVPGVTTGSGCLGPPFFSFLT